MVESGGTLVLDADGDIVIPGGNLDIGDGTVTSGPNTSSQPIRDDPVQPERPATSVADFSGEVDSAGPLLRDLDIPLDPDDGGETLDDGAIWARVAKTPPAR